MRRAAALLLFLTASSPALAQGLASGSAPSVPWARLLLAFALCVALAWAAVVLLRHFQRHGIANPLSALLARQGSRAPKRIAIVETRRASIHADLCLVECDDETFFLALTSAGATVLARRPSAESSR